MGVTHAGSADAAAEIAAVLTQRFDTPHVFTCTLGPVIGTHVGPGTVGAAVYGGD